VVGVTLAEEDGSLFNRDENRRLDPEQIRGIGFFSLARGGGEREGVFGFGRADLFTSTAPLPMSAGSRKRPKGRGP